MQNKHRSNHIAHYRAPRSLQPQASRQGAPIRDVTVPAAKQGRAGQPAPQPLQPVYAQAGAVPVVDVVPARASVPVAPVMSAQPVAQPSHTQPSATTHHSTNRQHQTAARPHHSATTAVSNHKQYNEAPQAQPAVAATQRGHNAQVVPAKTAAHHAAAAKPDHTTISIRLSIPEFKIPKAIADMRQYPGFWWAVGIGVLLIFTIGYQIGHRTARAATPKPTVSMTAPVRGVGKA